MCSSPAMPAMQPLPQAPKEPNYASYSKKATNTANYYGSKTQGTNSTNMSQGKVGFGLGKGVQAGSSIVNPLGSSGSSLQKQSLLGFS